MFGTLDSKKNFGRKSHKWNASICWWNRPLFLIKNTKHLKMKKQYQQWWTSFPLLRKQASADLLSVIPSQVNQTSCHNKHSNLSKPQSWRLKAKVWSSIKPTHIERWHLNTGYSLNFSRSSAHFRIHYLVRTWLLNRRLYYAIMPCTSILSKPHREVNKSNVFTRHSISLKIQLPARKF